MMPTLQLSAPAMAQDVPAVQGEAASLTDIARCLATSFERAEPRQRAIAYLRGLLSPTERQHIWPLAEGSGDATPSGTLRLCAMSGAPM